MMERNALAAYTRERNLHGLPREMRSVHYQLPPRAGAAIENSKRKPMVVPAKNSPMMFGPELPVTEASMEYAARDRNCKTWTVTADGRKTWHREAPPEAVAFGSSVPRLTTLDRTRGMNAWKQRVAREESMSAKTVASMDAEARVLASANGSSNRAQMTTVLQVATAFDVVTGRANETPQCKKCGQDRFWCPHLPRSQRGVHMR